MNTELIEKIKADLEKSGFSSELKSRKILIDNGWSVNAGYGYLDKDENKSREIDILATRVQDLKFRDKAYIYTEFHICGEVKKTESPWVVFEQDKNKLFLSCAWNNLISAINLPAEPVHISDTLMSGSLIKLNGWEGSSIHESFKKPNQPSRWYGAFVTVVKAAYAYLEDISPDGEKTTKDIIENPCELHFVQPVVVLNGPLFRAKLTSEGKLEVSEISSAAFVFDYKTKNYEKSSFRVDLVTLKDLDNYVKTVIERQDLVCKRIEKLAKIIA